MLLREDLIKIYWHVIGWIIKGTRKFWLPFWLSSPIFSISFSLVTTWTWMWLHLEKVCHYELCFKQSREVEAVFSTFRNGADFPWNISLQMCLCCNGGEEYSCYILVKLVESSCFPMNEDTYSFHIRNNDFKNWSHGVCGIHACLLTVHHVHFTSIQTITELFSTCPTTALWLGYPLVYAQANQL